MKYCIRNPFAKNIINFKNLVNSTYMNPSPRQHHYHTQLALAAGSNHPRLRAACVFPPSSLS